jgi:hypothetical protein
MNEHGGHVRPGGGGGGVGGGLQLGVAVREEVVGDVKLDRAG